MQARSPAEPSLQTTPISGLASPHPFGVGQGVVLRGGEHVVVHVQALSFSEPHWLPLKVVPAGHTLAVGSAPHSAGGHGEYETVPWLSSRQAHVEPASPLPPTRQ